MRISANLCEQKPANDSAVEKQNNRFSFEKRLRKTEFKKTHQTAFCLHVKTRKHGEEIKEMSSIVSSKSRIITLFVQILVIISATECESTGLFAIGRRRNKYSQLHLRQTTSIYDCECTNQSGDEGLCYDCKDDVDQTGRFAVEYEDERNMIRSAENAHIRHQQSIHVNHGDKNEAAALFRNMDAKHNSRGCVSSDKNNFPVFV